MVMCFCPGRLFSEDSLADLAAKFTTRNDDRSVSCTLCGKVCRDMWAAKTHLDCVHFPSSDGYPCNFCGKVSKSRHALTCHVSTYHREEANRLKLM